MLTKDPTDRLRSVLLLDAATCAAMGVLLTLGSRALAILTAIPAPLLFYAGVALFPIAAFMGITARRLLHSDVAVGLIVAGNVAWVGASLALIVGEWIAPNAFGYGFIGVQAAVVLVLTLAEHAAWRRTTRDAKSGAAA
jgi:hypothetical protein